MLTEQYKEIDTVDKSQFTALLNLVERERAAAEKAKSEQLVIEAKRMLKAWGAFNAYSSRCGYKNISSMFSALYPRCDKIVIENEIDFIESCLLELKKSNDKKKNEQYTIAELYYKGFDVVDCGCDWSERLTIRDIAEHLNIARSTTSDRMRAIESYIVAKIVNIKFIV